MEQKNGITLSTNQVHALVDISYNYGAETALKNFPQAYKQYGNTEALRQNYSVGKYGYPFVESGTNDGRNTARWKMFHDGVYQAGTGEILNPSSYSSSSTDTTATSISSTSISSTSDSSTSDSSTSEDSTNEESTSDNSSSVADGQSQGEKIVAEALKYVGNPYVWGGNSLTNGIDCSHFVTQILSRAIGYTGGWHQSSEWVNYGTPVASLAEAGAGDIVVYSRHVAIYDGNGLIVEAKGRNYGITHDRRADYANILGIRRFTTDGKVVRGSTITDSGTSSSTGESSDGTPNFVLKVATFSEDEESLTCDPDDSDVNEFHTHTYTMLAQEIDYQSLLNQYKMPFNYLWAMLVIGEEKDFVMDLADLAYNSKIEITVHDNERKNTDIVTDVYTKKTEIETTGNVAVSYEDENKKTGTEIKNESANYTKSTTYKKVHTMTTITNTLDTSVTLADTWNITYTKEYKYSNSTNESGKSTTNLEDVTGEWTESKNKGDPSNLNSQIKAKAESEVSSEGKIVSGSQISSSKTQYKHSTINASTTTQNIVESKKYTTTLSNVSNTSSTSSDTSDDDLNTLPDSSGGTYTENDNFVNLLKEHYDTRSNIVNTPDWLFEILSENSDTADMVDLTKYFLYKATNNDYGVTSLSLDILETKNFSKANSGEELSGDTTQEKVWNALRNEGFSEYAVAGVLGNIEAESGVNPKAIEKGSGEGIGLIQWSYGRKTALIKYAESKNAEWSDLNIQIEFLIAEMTGRGANGYATYQFINQRGYTEKDWENANSPEDAATAFCWTFERPNVMYAHLNVRTENAIKYYNQFHGK